MRYKTTLYSVSLMVITSIFLFRYYERQLSDLFVNLAVHPELDKVLVEAAEDKKILARLDSTQEAAYRSGFDRLQEIRNNLQILKHSREDMRSHFEYALWLLFAVVLVVAAGIHWVSQRRIQRRIEGLRQPLTDLANGRTDYRGTVRGTDVIGRIGAMIEQTAILMAGQRDRLRYLEHLSHWQEASRRHAHEIRTPLTAASMEAERLLALSEEADDALGGRIHVAAGSILEELDNLKNFTREFTSFARVRPPSLEKTDLAAFVTEFRELFAKAWDNLELVVDTQAVTNQSFVAWIDKDMIRQVLVNLCNNSSRSLVGTKGRVRLALRESRDSLIIAVVDNGPGIAPALRERLFEPYVTTRPIGEGMGLGLAIARKILLDHRGDLALGPTSDQGAEFVLTLPRDRPDRKDGV